MHLDIRKFFIVTPLDFETLAINELKNKWPLFFPNIELPKIIKLHGGFEVELSLIQGCSLNKILKIPTRVLLRLDDFQCRDFPKLFKKCCKLNWNEYLAGQTPEIEASSSNSRVFDSRRVQDTVLDAIKKYYKGHPPKKKDSEFVPSTIHFKVYLRFDDNFCTISIDTSGERLNVRGQRLFVDHAPIRENLAAGLIFKLTQFIKPLNLESFCLIDPMCGSGTFLLEAYSFYQQNNHRDFAYEYFPIITKKQVEPILEVSKLIASSYIGLDQSEKALDAATSNLTNTKIPEELISFINQDLFSANTGLIEKLKDENKVVILNPPYGKRLAAQNVDASFFEEIIDQVQKTYSPKVLGIIIPYNIYPQINKLYKSMVKDKFIFSNGGFKVYFAIF